MKYRYRRRPLSTPNDKCPICRCNLFFARMEHIGVCDDLSGTEHSQQVAAFEWLATTYENHPELRLVFAVPNGGLRHKATAIRLRREGVRAGVPDVCVPLAHRGFNG